MYKLLPAQVLLVALALCCQKDNGSQNFDLAGALCYWSFAHVTGTTLSDESGNANNGICVNTTVEPGSLFFDRVGSYVQLNNLSLFDALHQFSIIAKVKLKTLDTSGISWGRHLLRKENTIAFGFDASGTLGIWLYHNGWLGSWVFSTNGVDTNWHEVAAVWDGQKVSLYIDTVKDTNELAFPYPLAINTNGIFIGEFGSSRQEGLNGSISVLALYPFIKTHFVN